MDAFRRLGLSRCLELSSDEIREAFRQVGKSLHPDGGGEVGDFAGLQEAMECLLEPARRLRHWLEIRDIEGSMRGPVSPGVMDWFAEVGVALQEADGLVRERERASTVLARAMLEGRVQGCREKLEALQDRLERAEAGRVEAFPEVERGERDGWELARELAFLGKWRAEVKGRYAALW